LNSHEPSAAASAAGSGSGSPPAAAAAGAPRAIDGGRQLTSASGRLSISASVSVDGASARASAIALRIAAQQASRWRRELLEDALLAASNLPSASSTSSIVARCFSDLQRLQSAYSRALSAAVVTVSVVPGGGRGQKTPPAEDARANEA